MAGEISGILGIGLGQMGNQQQMHNQTQLNDQQLHNQMQLNTQMQGIQQQNWDYTNYENQVKHIEKAGLNVGMLYGMGGAGGSTMGGASGGSAQGGSAPHMDITNNVAQMAALQSQIDLNKATANKEQALADEANKWKRGNIEEDTKVKTRTAEGIEIDNAYKTGNLQTALETSKQTLNNLKAENTKLVAEGKKEQIDADYEERVKKLELISQGIENLLKQQQTAESKAKVINMQEMLKVEQQNATSKDRDSRANAKNADANFSNSLTNALKQLKESMGDSANEENQKFIDNLVKLLGMGAIGLGQASKPQYQSSRGYR